MMIIEDTRINSVKAVASPRMVCEEIPANNTAQQTTSLSRKRCHDILGRRDDRLILITGPCSIHDADSAKDYAQRLYPLIKRYESDLHIIMRVYFEKPRTTTGWKGLINDPNLDDSFDINKGLRVARRLLLDLNTIGVSAGTEYLDLITPQYVADLIAWAAIGARTTESQVHRELASGVSCPLGFKNGTYGTTSIAVDAIRAAQKAHHFLSVTKEGHIAIFETSGNDDCHIILRGGKEPNYMPESVAEVADSLRAVGLTDNIMIDLSHANSKKQHAKQLDVADSVAQQIAGGANNIIGVMIESNLVAGRQDIPKDLSQLCYGQSITDACIDWDDTVKLIEQFATAVRTRR